MLWFVINNANQCKSSIIFDVQHTSSGLTAWAEPHGLHGTADVRDLLHTNIALAIDGIAGFKLEAAAINPKPLVRVLPTSTSSWSTSFDHIFGMQ